MAKKKKNNIKKAIQSEASPLSHGSFVERLRTRLKTLRLFPGRQTNDSGERYRSFRLQKRIRPELKPLPTVLELLKQSLHFLWQHKWTFLKITLIYVLFYILILRSPIQPDMNAIKDSIASTLGQGRENSLQGNFVTASMVLTSGTGQQNDMMAGISIFAMSLVYVWAIRHLYNEHKIKARDAYYQAFTTVLPTFLITFLTAVQLLPFALASFMYSVARSTGVFVTGVEDLSFFIITLLICLLTFYLLTSSILALYASTIPGMYPMKALGEAKKLVRYQRFRVFRRIIALPIVIGIVYFTALLVIIRLLPAQAFLFVEVAQLIILPFVHIYLYRLYRALM